MKIILGPLGSGSTTPVSVVNQKENLHLERRHNDGHKLLSWISIQDVYRVRIKNNSTSKGIQSCDLQPRFRSSQTRNRQKPSILSCECRTRNRRMRIRTLPVIYSAKFHQIRHQGPQLRKSGETEWFTAEDRNPALTPHLGITFHISHFDEFEALRDDDFEQMPIKVAGSLLFIQKMGCKFHVNVNLRFDLRDAQKNEDWKLPWGIYLSETPNWTVWTPATVS